MPAGIPKESPRPPDTPHKSLSARSLRVPSSPGASRRVTHERISKHSLATGGRVKSTFAWSSPQQQSAVPWHGGDDAPAAKSAQATLPQLQEPKVPEKVPSLLRCPSKNAAESIYISLPAFPAEDRAVFTERDISDDDAQSVSTDYSRPVTASESRSTSGDMLSTNACASGTTTYYANNASRTLSYNLPRTGLRESTEGMSPRLPVSRPGTASLESVDGMFPRLPVSSASSRGQSRQQRRHLNVTDATAVRPPTSRSRTHPSQLEFVVTGKPERETPGKPEPGWSLTVVDKKLTHIPQYVFQRINLRDLHLANNFITAIPSEVKMLEFLGVLNIKNNQLSGLPKELEKLTCLQILDVSHNNIASLHDQLKLPDNLIEANLSYNKLVRLPETIFQNSRLMRVLDLSSNALERLPEITADNDWSNHLSSLESLNVHSNKLETVPPEILRMRRLCKLNVSRNRLRKLPREPWLSSNFREIECGENPSLCSPPPEIVNAGRVEVVSYMKAVARFERAQNALENSGQDQHAGGLNKIMEGEDRNRIEMTSHHSDVKAYPDTAVGTADSMYAREEVKQISKQLTADDEEHDPEDLEQNKSLCVIVTGTEGSRLESFLDVLCDRPEQNSETTSRLLQLGSGTEEEPAVWLTILRMRGSLLYDHDCLVDPAHKFTSRGGRNISPTGFRSKIERLQQEQMFRTHRSLFLLVFGVFSEDSEPTIVQQELDEATSMIREIRKNSPEARILVVPTARDSAVANAHVKAQIEKLRSSVHGQGDTVQVLDNVIDTYGESCGDGIDDLKIALRTTATGSAFYDELLPSYVSDIRSKIRRIRDGDRGTKPQKYISLQTFRDLATTCGLPAGDVALKIVTSILQDLGEIKYFGYATDGSMHDLLRDIIFIDVSWMMDAVDCLLDVDTTSIIEYFADHDPSLAYHATCLTAEGILHPTLIPFIWPSLDQNQTWPDVKTELIVCYWHAMMPKGGKHAVFIGSDRRSLVSAHKACIGLGLAVMNNSTDALFFASYRHVDALKGFDVSSNSSVVHSEQMPSVSVPKLANFDQWHEPSRVHMSMKEPFTYQRSRATFTKDIPEQTLAIFEWIGIRRAVETDTAQEKLIAEKNQSAQKSSPTTDTEAKPLSPGNTTKTVYQFTPRDALSHPCLIGQKNVTVNLRRSLRVSLKRRDTDPTSHVGFAAMLSQPNFEQDQSRFWDELKTLPKSACQGSSVYVEHNIVLYRIDAPPNAHVSAVGSIAKSVSEVVSQRWSQTKAKKLQDDRTKFERHLCFLLLSNKDGVALLRSLAYGRGPEEFLSELRKLYQNLEQVKDTNKIEKGISGLNDCLISLDVSHNPSLKGIPVPELCEIQSLNFIECVGSPQVYSLPPEVAKQGGSNAMEYLRLTQGNSTESRELQIIVIGNGEAGKSSLINCVRNQDGKSKKIHEDDRTVGIDISEWKPTPFTVKDKDAEMRDMDMPERVIEPDNLNCRFLDLAGQDVYGSSNQFFLVPRALYVIAWRVIKSSEDANDDMSKKKEELEHMIVNWMDSLQVRVPGASVVLVCTHIDAAAATDGEMTTKSWEEVNSQCHHVKNIVSRKLSQIHSDTAKSGVAALDVYNDGQSIRLNCLEGMGAPQLRSTLIEMAHGLPWWKELIPESYYALRVAIDKLRKEGKVWITWETYKGLAAECKIQKNHILIATYFLNDMAVIKYFGTLDDEGKPEDPKDILDNTIFISPTWIIDGLKGLIRHDREILMEYVQHKIQSVKDNVSEKKLLKHINRLANYGVCDHNLVPFLWPDGRKEGSGREYWEWLKENNRTEELRLWPGVKFAESQEDYDRVIALLEGCDFVFTKKDKTNTLTEFVAPVLLAQNSRVDPRSLSNTDSPITHEYTVTGMAPGFLQRLLVRVQRAYSHTEISKNVGIFYGRALKTQIFLYKVKSEDLTKSASAVEDIQEDKRRPPSPVKRSNRHKSSQDHQQPPSILEVSPVEVSPGGRFVKKPVQASSAKASTKSKKSRQLRSKFDLMPAVGDAAKEETNRVESDKYTLKVCTSTRMQQMLIARSVRDLKVFFPGLAIEPFPNDAVMKANVEWAGKEPVQIRVFGLNHDNEAKVKKVLIEIDQDQGRQILPLRIDAGGYDLERGEGHERNTEKYMDFPTRVALVCMERYPDAEHEVPAASNLRHQIKNYEEKYNCLNHHKIMDPSFAKFLSTQVSTPKDTPRAKIIEDGHKCTHKRGQRVFGNDLGCHECLQDEAKKLVKDRQYEDAETLILEAIRVRELMDNRHPRRLFPWNPEDKALLDGMALRIDNHKRVLVQRPQRPTKTLEVISQEESVMRQILAVDECCRKCDQEQKRFKKTSFSGESQRAKRGREEVTMAVDLVDPEFFQDDLEKFVYFQKKYYLLLTRLEVLQNLRRLSEQIPEVENENVQMAMRISWVSDERRALDAAKGQRQKVDEMEEKRSILEKQIKDAEELEKGFKRTNRALELELKWFMFTAEFEWHIRKRCPIIPLIMPGYFEQLKRANGRIDFSKWWPDQMSALENHALFVDLTNDVNYEEKTAQEEVSMQKAGQGMRALLNQINNILDKWRGRMPDPDTFEVPTHIPCYLCAEHHDAGMQHVHMFDRREVELRIDGWRKKQLENMANGSEMEQARHRIYTKGLNEEQAFLGNTHEEADLVMQCKKDQAHVLDAVELLSTGVIFEALSCPQCLKSNDLPPHCFNRKACIEFFSEQNQVRT